MPNQNQHLSLSDIIGDKAEVSSTNAEVKPVEENKHKPMDVNKIRTVQPSDIKPMAKKRDYAQESADYHLKLIDEGIERTKKDLLKIEDRLVARVKENQEKKEFNGEANIDDAETMTDIIQSKALDNRETSNTHVTEVKPEATEAPIIHNDAKAIDVTPNTDLAESISNAKEVDFDENDFNENETEKKNDESMDSLEESVNDDEMTDEERKDEFNKLQKAVREYIAPPEIDISQFKISNSPLSINKAMSRISASDPGFSASKDTVLFNTGKTIAMTPLTGSEIVALSNESYGSKLEVYRKTFNIMYNHTVGINKTDMPFTKWLKSVDASDISQLYFGLYNATFADSNYIGYQCPECKTYFMVKKNISDMYSFSKDADPKLIKRYNDIKEHGEVEDNFASRVRSYALSSKYIIEIHPRSLFNILELEYLDDVFKKKYASILQPMSYISKIYYVEENTHTLRPIDMKPDKDSIIKTIKNKCVVMYKLISSITTDEYAMLSGILASYGVKEVEAADFIEYHIPETDCIGEFKDGTKCTHHFDKNVTVPYQLLFTRHQLALQSTLRVD